MQMAKSTGIVCDSQSQPNKRYLFGNELKGDFSELTDVRNDHAHEKIFYDDTERAVTRCQRSASHLVHQKKCCLMGEIRKE